MYKAIFLTALLAIAEVVQAIPVPMRLMFDENNGSEAEQKNFAESIKEANGMLRQAERMIKKAKKDPQAQEHLKEAFGPNWQAHLPQLKQDIRRMRTADMRVFDTSADKTKELASNGQSFYGFVRKDANQAPVAHFGDQWHGSDTTHRAGIMVHELSHAVLRTGDHVAGDPATKTISFINSEEALAHERRKTAKIARDAGYIHSDTTSIKEHGIGDTSPFFTTGINHATNPTRNADSWRALMALGQREKERNIAVAQEQREQAQARRQARLDAKNQQASSVRGQGAVQGAQLTKEMESCAISLRKRGLTDDHPAYHGLVKRCAVAKAKTAERVKHASKPTSSPKTGSKAQGATQKMKKANKSGGKSTLSTKVAKGKAGIPKKGSLSANKKAKVSTKGNTIAKGKSLAKGSKTRTPARGKTSTKQGVKGRTSSLKKASGKAKTARKSKATSKGSATRAKGASKAKATLKKNVSAKGRTSSRVGSSKPKTSTNRKTSAKVKTLSRGKAATKERTAGSKGKVATKGKTTGSKGRVTAKGKATASKGKTAASRSKAGKAKNGLKSGSTTKGKVDATRAKSVGKGKPYKAFSKDKTAASKQKGNVSKSKAKPQKAIRPSTRKTTTVKKGTKSVASKKQPSTKNPAVKSTGSKNAAPKASTKKAAPSKTTSKATTPKKTNPRKSSPKAGTKKVVPKQSTAKSKPAQKNAVSTKAAQKAAPGKAAQNPASRKATAQKATSKPAAPKKAAPAPKKAAAPVKKGGKGR
ncbi:hypothetical protein CPB86DRAFT_186881 [Serendipita vermifera]|nr:hypothetical protein CPB86DRAFT_186881 [Serendipita vermifera]